MKNCHILTLAAAALLAVTTTYAQAPAGGAAPAATTPPPATGTTPPTAGEAKPKPLSSVEGKALVDLLSAMQFHIRMSEVGRQKNKDDKDMVTFAGKGEKEMKELFTPIISAAQAGGVNPKSLEAVAAVSKSDKSDIDKLGKTKPEKWKQEYFELLAKNGKRNARVAENAVKSISDPQTKDLANKASTAINRQVTEAEAKVKELKEKK
jgi:hypothetical protein